jgi:ribose-phosphate pyrophosphokinase
MQKRDRGKLALIACNSGSELTKRIASTIRKIYKRVNLEIDTPGFPIVHTEEMFFSNGEVKTIIHDHIRGDDVYIIQCMDDPLSERSINDNFMALISAVDAANQSDADNITVVIPQYPYSRQERRKAREGITAKLIAKFLETAGAKRVLTIDIHSEAIAGFFSKGKLENFHASAEIIEHYKNHHRNDDSFVVVAPDVGSAERARYFAKMLKHEMAVIDKARNYQKQSTIESMRLIGDVKDRNVLAVDDMIATGGTIINACRVLKDEGAKDIYLACTFPFFNGNAVDKLDKAYSEGLIKGVIGTDAVYRGEKFIKDHPWYEEVSIAPLLAHVIYRINHKLSLSEILDIDKPVSED